MLKEGAGSCGSIVNAAHDHGKCVRDGRHGDVGAEGPQLAVHSVADVQCDRGNRCGHSDAKRDGRKAQELAAAAS